MLCSPQVRGSPRHTDLVPNLQKTSNNAESSKTSNNFDFCIPDSFWFKGLDDADDTATHLVLVLLTLNPKP